MLSVLSTLEALQEGRIIRNGVARLLHALAWLTLAIGAVLVVTLLKAAFTDRVPVEATIAGLLCAGLAGGTAWVMARITFFHACEIIGLDEGRFVMIPIVSILLRLLGEQLAAWWIAVGVIGALAAVVAGPFAGFLLSAAELPTGFLGMGAGGLLGAVGALAVGLSLAAGLLLTSYLAAELLIVAADVAHKAGQLVDLARQQAGPEAAQAPATATDPVRGCPRCGTPVLEPSTRYCERCGGLL